MLIGKYRAFVLLTPNAVTGGPEAVHQLAQIMRELGLDAKILIYRDPADIRIADGVLSHPPETNGVVIKAYRHYEPVYTASVELSPDTLVILPETRADIADRLAPSPVAVWWLSVHNGYVAGTRMREDEAYRSWIFTSGQVMHFYQTEHARRMMKLFKSKTHYPLVDYTDAMFTQRKPTGPNAGTAIAFNPRKGDMHYKPFFAANPEFVPLPIDGMTKAQVFEALSNTRIFVEFGHNPGKDRMPREAACAGAIVLARLQGGSELFEDTPIGPQHKFDNAAVHDGRLAAMLRAIAADPQPHWDAQAYYRNDLFTEAALMRVQAKRLFDL